MLRELIMKLLGREIEKAESLPVGYYSEMFGDVMPLDSLEYAGKLAGANYWRVLEVIEYPIYGTWERLPAWDTGKVVFEGEVRLVF